MTDPGAPTSLIPTKMQSKDATIFSEFRHDLRRWQQLVSPAWLAALIAGDHVTAAPAKQWRLLEIGYCAMASYLHAHIPGASYVDTTEFELGPLWNKVPDDELLALLLRCGIRHDTTVILYGRNPLAAARAAHLMLYAGVTDVRLIDGGYAAWTRLRFPLEHGFQDCVPAATEFGAPYPGHPEYLVDTGHVRDSLAQTDVCLASVRTWNEFVGRTSGYSYIRPRGEIAGARWGRSGSDDDVNCISEFHDAHGRMKPASEICRLWDAKGIRPNQAIIFYCGTGWRASLAFFYAWLMQWERVSVYDGGWHEWSLDPRNPVICRADAAYESFRNDLVAEPFGENVPSISIS
jgi:3-mercaptopyruvate sulfurtransferase SseA